MRENRPSGLMKGGKQTVIALCSQPVASRLLYTPFDSLYNGAKRRARRTSSRNLGLCGGGGLETLI